MGPYDLGGDWSDKGIVGVDRFVQRLFTLANNQKDLLKRSASKNNEGRLKKNECQSLFQKEYYI